MKKIKAFLAAFLLATSSLFVLATPHAFAATKTWDGGGGDNNMTTGANWDADTAPTAGDDLVFPANVTNRTAVNNFTAGTSFNSITFSGAASADSTYTLSGSNSMTLVAGINNSMTGSASDIDHEIAFPLALNGTQTFQSANGNLTISGTLNTNTSALTITPGSGKFFIISGVISGSGAITKTGAGTLSLSGANTTYSGAITASAGRVIVEHNSGLGATSGATTISSGADLTIGNCSEMTVAENITLTGDSSNTSTPLGKLTTGAGCSGSGADEIYGTAAVTGDITLSGNITLGSNVTLAPLAATTTLTGGLSGDFAISLFSGYGGKLVVNSSSNTSQTTNGTYTSPVKEVTLSDSLPSNTVFVAGNTVVILTGTRGSMTIAAQATLKGTGTAANVTVADGGTIAPGLSPGCLTVSDLTLAGSLDVEIGGTTACTGYDQIIVNGAVDLTDGSLALSLFDNYKPKVGEKYVIINNDGSDAIIGTFTDIAEGGTVTLSGYSFKVSYVGGDGNDVELTVLATPPATGFTLIKSNPLVTAGLVIVAAFGILLIARRSNKLFIRR